ncbi:Arm DNA-binding domain-containing protein [Maribacter flavus]|uniref:Arm DNA-binding domain-containing protein n=1 Tax=Maribacter flavus TaxID=1658664 RepID=A0ABU7IGB8_9FLAO|nr:MULTISPECIES: Arm DNA-binding domain-containing protein [Maribacter]MDC6405199.1 Arm DNA-binding domain-containing protein [Maribacter sp. PR66]MEE1971992.1 Arm DNA-binding domain-containing protein [Maribacter flavus]
MFTGKYILEKDWDNVLGRVKKSHINSARLNNYLLKKLTEVDSIALEADASKEYISSKQIKQNIKVVLSLFSNLEQKGLPIDIRQGNFLHVKGNFLC